MGASLLARLFARPWARWVAGILYLWSITP